MYMCTLIYIYKDYFIFYYIDFVLCAEKKTNCDPKDIDLQKWTYIISGAMYFESTVLVLFLPFTSGTWYCGTNSFTAAITEAAVLLASNSYYGKFGDHFVPEESYALRNWC